MTALAPLPAAHRLAARAGTAVRRHWTHAWRALALALLCLGGTGAHAQATPWVGGFYVGWMASSYPPSAVDYTSLTHVMMFSVLPRNDGTLDTSFFGAGTAVAGEIAQRAHAAGRKAVLVVGGAGYDGVFRSASSAANIDRFVQNLANAVAQLGYDGIDIDWEPILEADRPTVLSLVDKLRAALPAGKLITVDVNWVSLNFPLDAAGRTFYAALAAKVDQMNIMTYSMADDWGGWVSWHNSALDDAAANRPSSVKSSVNAYLAAGIPAAKLGIGIGFYGACWNAPVNGPRQDLSANTSRVVAGDNDMGYGNIMGLYYNAAAYRYDTAAQTPYLSFASPTGPKGCTFISYEDPTSVAAKAQYVRQQGLGGTIIWQINEGYRPGAANPNELLAAVGAAFLGGGATSPPAAPSALAAAAAASNRVNLAWTDNASDESGFKVERSSDGTNFSQVGVAAMNATTYADTTVSAGLTYTYRVRATNAAGDSAYTNTATATTPATAPAAPQYLSAKVSSATAIALTWRDRASNEQGFYVERSSNGGATWGRIATLAANSTRYTASGLTAATTYSFRVQAFAGAAVSAYSNTVTATTKVR